MIGPPTDPNSTKIRDDDWDVKKPCAAMTYRLVPPRSKAKNTLQKKAESVNLSIASDFLFFNMKTESFMLPSLTNLIIIVTLRLTLLQYHLEHR